MRNLHSLRQTSSVEEGITELYEKDDVTVVCYEPGNMTRYVLTFSEVPPESCRLLAVDPGAAIVSDINRRTSYVFQPEGLLLFNYVGDKLSRREPDAVVITELIGFIMNRPVISCEEYTKKVLAVVSEEDEAEEVAT